MTIQNRLRTFYLPIATCQPHELPPLNIFHIYEGVVKLRAGQMGEIDNVVGYLADPPSDLFSRSQVQLDSFARVALKDAEHTRIRLEGGFFLRQQAGTSDSRNNDSEKK